jgi:trigger factor
MKYELKKLENSAVKLTIELDKKEIERHKEKACEDISKDLKIPGFRPGHAPTHVLEQYVNKKHILAHTYELAVQMSYAEAVMKEKLQVVASPKIKFISDTTKEEDTFKFEAEVAVLPEVKVKDYKSIKVPKEEVKVTEKEVNEVIDDMKTHLIEWKDTDRAVKKGDRVELDFEGFDPKDEKKIPNTESKNHPVIVGENTMVPGFEDQIIGMKKDEKKEFEISFPKEYHNKDFQGKKVLFKIELKRIEEGEKPELNEAMIEKITGQKLKVEEFKKDLEKNIKAQKTQKAEQDRENKYLEELLKRAEVEIPEALIEQEIDFIIEDMQKDMAQRGVPFEKFLEQTKLKLEDLREKYKKEAEKRVKIRMALTHVIEQEKAEVTDKELDEEMQKIISMYPKDQQDKIKEDLEKGNDKMQIKNKLLLRKFFAKVLG